MGHGSFTKTFVEMARSRAGFYRRKAWKKNIILFNSTLVACKIDEMVSSPRDDSAVYYTLTNEDIEADDWYEIFMGS